MKVSWPQVAGIVLVLVASASIAQSFRAEAADRRRDEVQQQQAEELRTYAECQARVNDALIARTRALIEVAEKERVAQRARDDALDATFLDPSLLKPAEQRTVADRKRVTELYLTYRQAAETLRAERAAADKVRAANPVPAPPSEVCR